MINSFTEQRLLIEAYNSISKMDIITFEDVEELIKRGKGNYDFGRKLHYQLMVDWYHSSDPYKASEIKEYFVVLNTVYKTCLELGRNLNIPYIDKNYCE